MKPGKHQRSKQRCQDLGWKVHDGAQSFALSSYTMHELRNQHVSIVDTLILLVSFYWLVPQYGVNNYCVLCTVKAQKGTKTYNKELLSGFITIPLY